MAGSWACTSVEVERFPLPQWKVAAEKLPSRPRPTGLLEFDPVGSHW